MAQSKSKVNPAPSILGEEPLPSVGESKAAAVFDDDSMFNSADRQPALLQRERARRTGPQKRTKAPPRQSERRKTG